MTRNLTATFLIGVGLLLAGTTALAHHSQSGEFDRNKPIEFTGTVKAIEWTNPRGYVQVEVKGSDGKVVKWEIELGSPAMLMRNGWTRSSIKIGESVTVEGSLAKDGSKLANARSVRLANGTRVFAGSSGGDGPGGPNPNPTN